MGRRVRDCRASGYEFRHTGFGVQAVWLWVLGTYKLSPSGLIVDN